MVYLKKIGGQKVSSAINFQKPSDDYILNLSEGYNQFLLVGFIQTLFSSIGSALRIFVRALDAGAWSSGTAEFESIYNWLLSNERLNLIRYIELLNILRHIRNAIHNNGVYFHKSGIDKPVQYKGIIYKFEIGKRIEFSPDVWTFLCNLLPNILEMIDDIVSSNQIITLGQINDPFVP